MAGAILTSLLKRLSSLPLGASSSSSTELQSSSSSDQELQKLARTMSRILALLEDAEERDVSDKSEQLRLRELKEVAYDAEDAVDEYEYDVLHAKVEARRRAMATKMGNRHDKVIFDLNSYHPKVSTSDELAGRVKDIRKRFEEITDDWSRINLSEKVGKRRCTTKWKPTETASCFDEGNTFGRENEKNKIIKWLLQEEESNSGAVSVMGVVGMGGLGKTTLAQMAYNDPNVCQHFDLRGWAHVSQDFDVVGLVRKICNSFDMDLGNVEDLRIISLMSLDELHRKLKVMLHGKKFFLVLDDVWNQKIELWSQLKSILVGVGLGKILVTTRNERVAKIMETTSSIKLEVLSLVDSSLLFEKIAYEGRDQNNSDICKRIVDKCRGLPLAIKVLAGIIRVEDEEDAWAAAILDSELWDLGEESYNIFPALKLSYDCLPVELKQCFMYLSLFPKGSDLDKSVVIELWVSNGFIPAKGKKLEEDVGNDYYNEFLQRSILQYCIIGPSRREVRMHDLIHDLAQYVAKDEYLLLTNLKSHYMIPKTIRHVSMHIKNRFEIKNLESFLGEAKHLRTLLCRVRGEISNNIMDQLPNIRSLRTLVLLNTWEPVELPDSIDRLKHLRYLRIHGAKSIPASVYRLHFLQTLTIDYPLSKIKLSRDVGDLINLRHLRGYDPDYPLPREVAGLTNLQTLQYITLGVGDEWFKLRDLKGLPNLRGSRLQVRGLETVAWCDVTPLEAYLKDTRGIKQLWLQWGYVAEEEELVGDVDEKERLAAQVLDSLQPHRGLESMCIHGYPGVRFPAWLGHELPVLEWFWMNRMTRVKSLVLPAMKEMEKKSEPSHGLQFCRRTEDDDDDDVDIKRRRCFPSLRWLRITRMNGLEEWQQQGVEEDPDFLPCLGDLTIEDCPKLRTLPSLLSHLRHLFIKDCPELRRLPSLPSLTRLGLMDEFSHELLNGGCCCLPMLQFLDIISYRGDSLIFPNDRSLDPLEKLSICNCSQLRSAEGLGGLPSLRHLKINMCPLLRISTDDLQDVQMEIFTEIPHYFVQTISWAYCSF